MAKAYEHHGDADQFTLALRDFLVQLKELTGAEEELFSDEREAELRRQAEREREAAMRIPGMLKPSQMEDDDI